MRRESAGLVHLGQGGPDLPSSEGGGGEKAGGNEDGGAGIAAQVFPEDALTPASQLIGRYGQLLPQHKSGPVHVDPPSLRPNCRPHKSAARQMIAAS